MGSKNNSDVIRTTPPIPYRGMVLLSFHKEIVDITKKFMD